MPTAIDSAMKSFNRVIDEYELSMEGFDHIKMKLI